MEITDIEKLKIAHDHCVNAHQIITQRTQFYSEEFDAVKGCAEFLKEMALKLRGQIEALVPKEDEKVADEQNDQTVS
jgi:hypothetical protein